MADKTLDAGSFCAEVKQDLLASDICGTKGGGLVVRQLVSLP